VAYFRLSLQAIEKSLQSASTFLTDAPFALKDLLASQPDCGNQACGALTSALAGFVTNWCRAADTTITSPFACAPPRTRCEANAPKLRTRPRGPQGLPETAKPTAGAGSARNPARPPANADPLGSDGFITVPKKLRGKAPSAPPKSCAAMLWAQIASNQTSRATQQIYSHNFATAAAWFTSSDPEQCHKVAAVAMTPLAPRQTLAPARRAPQGANKVITIKPSGTDLTNPGPGRLSVKLLAGFLTKQAQALCCAMSRGNLT
jgi:hypothetical protein